MNNVNDTLNKKLDLIFDLIFAIYARNPKAISEALEGYNTINFELRTLRSK